VFFLKKKKLAIFFIVQFILSLGFCRCLKAETYDHFIDEVYTDSRWLVNDSDGICTYNAASPGLLEFNTSISNNEFLAVSSYCFTGDFDVRMNYQDWSLNAQTLNGIENANTVQVGLAVVALDSFYEFVGGGESISDAFYVARSWQSIGGGKDLYFSSKTHNGINTKKNEKRTSDTVGFLKISRTGDDFNTYYSSNNTDWTSLLGDNDVTAGPIVAGMYCYSGDEQLSLSSFAVDINYVEITSDDTDQVVISEPNMIMLLGGLFTGFFGIVMVKKRK